METFSLEDVEFNPYKWVNHIDKIKKIAAGDDVFPITVELDLVSYCNHNCNWCVDPLHMKDQLDIKFISKLILEMQQLGVQGLVLKGGGEPTLSPCFREVLKEANKRLLNIGIVTNGSKLTDLYSDIVKYASYIRVSIDGPTSSSHKNIHGSSDFSLIREGVSKLLQERESLKQRHPVVGLSFAMSYSMKDLVSKAIKLGDELGVDYILLRPPFFEEVGAKNTMSTNDKKDLFMIFENEKKAYKGSMKIFIDYWVSDTEAKEFDCILESPRRAGCKHKGVNGIEHLFECSATPLFAVVAANKKIYPCCNLRFIKGYELGEINYEQGDTFKKIWSSENRKKIIKQIKSGNCLRFCTHPLSKYNEIIRYLRTPCFHKEFI